MNYLAQRRQTLARRLTKDGPDAVLVTAAVNVTYLTGFTGEASYLVVTPKTTVLVTDQRFEAQVLEDCPDVGRDGGAVDLHVRPHDRTTLEAAAEVLIKAGAKAVAVEAGRMTLAEAEALRGLAPKCTVVPLADLVEALRVVKDPSEVEHIRAAVKVAERGFKMFAATVREADTEKDLADALDHWLRRAGAKGMAFPPIVAVGERGALPHAPPTANRLGDGSKLLVDWGVEAATGYKSDMTRTLRSPFQAAPTRRNKFERVGYELDRVYEVVLAAQDAALAAIRHGVKARDVDSAARKVITDAGYGEHFTHGLGHGLGLEVHEAPRVRQNSDDVLEAGMVITVEPGVYIPGEGGRPGWGGVRIEDDVLVTRDGCTLLTTLPRNLSAAGDAS